MGIVQRQGLQNSFFTYLGVALGMVNVLILFPGYLDGDELGLIKLLPLLAVLYAQFSSLGFSSVVLRFFPFFKDKARKHHGFLPAVMTLTLAAFVVVSFVFWVIKPWMVDRYAEESALFIDYYYFLIPLSLFWMWNAMLDAFLGALYKSVLPTFVRGLLIHILNTAAILLFHFGGIGFPAFLYLFVGLNFIPTLLMIAYLIYLGHFHMIPRSTFRLKMLWRKMIVQGGYVMLNGIASYFYQVIDSMMLMAYLGYSGLTAVGVYVTMIPIVRIITIPASSMYKVVYPLIGEHWKNQAIDKIESLYKKVSIVNLVLGSYIFMCILVNMHVLFQDPFPLTGPEWEVGKGVIFIIGLARMYDLATGANSTIIVTSRYYRANTVFMLSILVLAPLTNWIFIPKYGIIGAAIATTLTSFTINTAQIIFVWITFRIQPFSWKTIVICIILAIVASLGYVLPHLDFFILDVLYRTIICSLIYWVLVFKLKVSEDVRQYVGTLLAKVGLEKLMRFL